MNENKNTQLQTPACGISEGSACGAAHWRSKSEEQWRKLLTPEQFRIAREAGTERPFTGKYWNSKTKGTYQCACCGQPLFRSETKFESGTGWPSFWEPISPEAVTATSDRAY